MSSFGEDKGNSGRESHEAQREDEWNPGTCDHERASYRPRNHARCEVSSVHLEKKGGSLSDGDDVGYEGIEHGCDDTSTSADADVMASVRRGYSIDSGQHLGSGLTVETKR